MGRRGVSSIVASLLAGCALVTGASDLRVVSEIVPMTDASTVEDAPAGDDGPRPTTCDEPGLVAHWTFDESSGTAVRDCTSNHHDGTFVGAVSRTAGVKGGAVRIEGGHVDFGDPAGLRLTGAMTAAFWVEMENAGDEYAYFVGRRSNTSSGWRVSRENTQYGFAVTGPPDGVDLYAGTVVFGTWLHVAGVFRPGSAMELYVDGISVGRSTNQIPTSIRLENDTFVVGARGDQTLKLRGKLDDIRIYDRALDTAEIVSLATR